MLNESIEELQKKQKDIISKETQIAELDQALKETQKEVKTRDSQVRGSCGTHFVYERSLKTRNVGLLYKRHAKLFTLLSGFQFLSPLGFFFVHPRPKYPEDLSDLQNSLVLTGRIWIFFPGFAAWYYNERKSKRTTTEDSNTRPLPESGSLST